MTPKTTSTTPSGKIEKTDMVGSFEVAPLFDICQFLLLGQRTGTLSIYREGPTVRFCFADGQIINAIEESAGAEGREVALGALQTTEGSFHFRREEVSSSRLIEDATQNLLLDAARRMDELENGEPSGEKKSGDSSLENELREKQEKADSLRSLFSQIEGEMAREGATDSIARLLDKTAEMRGDLLYLREGSRPVVVRGGRVVERLPGRVRDEVFREVRLSLDGNGLLEQGTEKYRLVEGFAEGVIALRKISHGLSLADLNFPVEAVESLLRGKRGIILLTADPPEAGSALFFAIRSHLIATGQTAIELGDSALQIDDAGLVISHPRPINRVTYRHLHSQVASFQPSYVLAPELRSREDATLLLDLARTGRGVITTLPGRSGADALCRAAHWFREESTLHSAAALMSGILAIRIAPGESGKELPITSASPWTAEAARLLVAEDYPALESLLEKEAGEASFRNSLARLVQSSLISREEAERLAPLLPAPAAGN